MNEAINNISFAVENFFAATFQETDLNCTAILEAQQQSSTGNIACEALGGNYANSYSNFDCTPIDSSYICKVIEQESSQYVNNSDLLQGPQRTSALVSAGFDADFVRATIRTAADQAADDAVNQLYPQEKYM